ncbi:MAG TPA: D-glycero-beta-D-manno-heptose 1-phosphate adenylyltransferase [Thermomicrobiaceae bacterium]|nr:D-glycero-beta-D-manno-heptose 1-phosphate adenylyltransferase [Thermomicrobiaceae bacterium]
MTGAIETVRGFRRLRALVIGDAMLDSYLEGTAARLCAEGPVPVVRKTAEERLPGGAANTAANLAALGAEVLFLGVVGADPAGGLLRAALRDHDVDDSWLIEDDQISTLHKLRILANGQYVVRFDEGGAEPLGRRTYERLLATLDHAFPRCDLVVISDYNYGVHSDGLVRHLRGLRRARPCVLAVDSKHLGRFREASATIITPNHLEALLAVDGAVPAGDELNLHEVRRAGRRLVEAIETEHVAVTLGAGGVCLIDRRGRARHFPAHPVANPSDVGAGDSFLAALALALAGGARCPEAVQIGIEAAGIAVSKRRTAVVLYQELLQRVSLREHLPRAGDLDVVGAVVAQLDAARERGRKIVFTNGVFDILHAGHVEFLRRARALGDVLVVGVNSDRSARLLKGKNRPINSEEHRLALVAALDAVDHALLFDEETPEALIRDLRPHIHAKGGDYAGEELPEAEAVAEVGGRVVILPLVGDLSTSAVIDRIVALAGDGMGDGA